jgi:hypothetical protein
MNTIKKIVFVGDINMIPLFVLKLKNKKNNEYTVLTI